MRDALVAIVVFVLAVGLGVMATLATLLSLGLR